MAFAAVATFVVGLILVLATLSSALRTMVVPRGVPSALVRVVFITIRRGFRVVNRLSPGYEKLDRRMAFYAPVGLLALPVAWLTVSLTGYALMFWALGARPLRAAYAVSGSSMFTLGMVHRGDLPSLTLTFTEAGVGVGLLALLITYLPSIYTTFARREQAVALLETRAGSPPWGPNMIMRYYRIGWPGGFDQVWRDWQLWFADIEESHTSLGALAFFRSPQPDRSWVTAAGAVLDGAALVVSTVADHHDPEAQLLVRAGYVSMRRIADSYDMVYDDSPAPDDPISITRAEYDDACELMEAAGVPLNPDREQSWRDFAGWRVNYDDVLRQLAGLVDAAPAPWSSDRALPWRPPRLFHRRRKPRRPPTP